MNGFQESAEVKDPLERVSFEVFAVHFENKVVSGLVNRSRESRSSALPVASDATALRDFVMVMYFQKEILPACC